MQLCSRGRCYEMEELLRANSDVSLTSILSLKWGKLVKKQLLILLSGCVPIYVQRIWDFCTGIDSSCKGL
jgi:hypothetical protein